MTTSKIQFFLIILIIPFFHGCATRISNLTVDPGFTKKAVLTSPFLVGPVTSTVNEFLPQKQQEFGDLLLNTLQTGKPGAFFTRANIPAKEAGNVNLEIQEEFKETGTLTPKIFNSIIKVRPGYRYLIMARIDHDQTIRSYSYDTAPSDHETYEDRETGRTRSYVTEITVTHEYDTRRDIAVLIKIFDLVRQKEVWSATLTTFAIKRNMYDEEQDTFFSWGPVLVKDESSKPERYPLPEKLTVLFKQVFQKFTKKIP